ncbi:MAG: type II toxin-antitoxin system VapC family toxin [Actinobacteria bacterium]|nr:type II toxin-antitoxin system VapC family toxin [Actinomycetota bacterium]
MIVVDASVAVLGLLNDGAARRTLAVETVAVPHLADSEVAHALRSQVLRGTAQESQALDALLRWALLGIRRFAVTGLLGRIWELRGNLSAYDASYVALAEAMSCPLHTADARLASAPGPSCTIVVVRR